MITIEVTTAQGTFLRAVRPASILPEGVERGPIAEDAIRGAAARFGLPDFVFHPATERRGAGTREIGDAIIVTGRRGLSLQVKARQQVTDDVDRERAWLERRAAEGSRHATGTIRRLRYPGTTRLENSGEAALYGARPDAKAGCGPRDRSAVFDEHGTDIGAATHPVIQGRCLPTVATCRRR